MRRMTLLTGGVLGGTILLGGCDSSPGLFCTSILKRVGVLVVDTVDAGVAGLSPVTTRVRTGQVITLRDKVDIGGGRYVVIGDLESNLINRNGETFRFSVSQGSRSATADFVVDMGDEDGCHIRKISGPASVTLH